ncbi:MAG: glucosyl-3-phosphoglycerate synthase [Ilumatobacter sp.]|nr:glucosyl-3-phosphoglycerate synthase [Ilumatobacter sp.]
MTGVRTFDASPVGLVAAAKHAARGHDGGPLTVSVCIPCRDEATTIGELVSTIKASLVDQVGLVDELVVIDDRSVDDTARLARDAGARVVHIEDIHDVHGPGHGKGNVLWASLLASRGDVVVWLDGDLTTFEPSWVAGLLEPLIAHDDIALVKAASERPDDEGGGGRTTELVARPLMSLYLPELTPLRQPLAGEYAVRRSVVETLPFVTGWGVEMALLIDIARAHGAGSIAQVDVGVRRHRHQPLTSLSVQAAEVMATVLERVGAGRPTSSTFRRADGVEVELNLGERPPVAQAASGPLSGNPHADRVN